jgi:hypothetical protein
LKRSAGFVAALGAMLKASVEIPEQKATRLWVAAKELTEDAFNGKKESVLFRGALGSIDVDDVQWLRSM